MKERFLVCETCGNLIGRIHDSGVPMICCGAPMKELEANTVEASQEKHLPVVSRQGQTIRVQVGAVAHPMTEEHHITWIYLETQQGGQRKGLKPGDAPELCFTLCEDEAVAVYAYCNLHGLWKVTL